MLKQSLAWASLIVSIGLYFSPQVSLADEQPLRPTNISSNLVAQPIRLEINISRRQLTLYHENMPIKRYPVAVGRPGWETPTGYFQVIQMIQKPRWIHPFTGKAIPGGHPQNPLGRYWIGFWTNGRDWVGLHGTPNPRSIGGAVSHGCIRMYNEDINELFHRVSVGTPVKVVP
jgi:lipoprotein-anchoring transpeptidase ErfK/SrfK